LNISVDTVKTHLNNSFRKLELDGRLALGMLVQRRVIPKRNVTSGAQRTS
jgi:DNA-binding CsgD family transcriptional regulator